MFYKSLVLPRLMYGAAESWALTEAQGAQLAIFHNGCLRQMGRGPDGSSTAELLARTSQANMADRRHRVRWLGQPASLMMSWSSSCFLRTPSRATLGPWGAPTSRGWTPPCTTWAA